MVYNIHMKKWNVSFWILIGITIVLAILNFSYVLRASAATNINSAVLQHFAWSDIEGWWDLYGANNINVNGMRMNGYASSSAGEISFDCATSPSGNICGISNYGVCNGLATTHNTDGTCTNSDASGSLYGYAWNDIIGWVALNCRNTASNCGSGDWGVSVNNLTGDFSGYAWSDLEGWISFNCANNSSCASSNFKVNTSFRTTSTIAMLDSAVVDTLSSGGSTLNSITWTGTTNANSTGQQTFVDFQIAVSASSGGPWNFMGPSGTNLDYYAASCESGYAGGTAQTAPQNTPICINPTQVKDMRYLKYRVRLRSDLGQTDTPRVDNVILNWSK